MGSRISDFLYGQLHLIEVDEVTRGSFYFVFNSNQQERVFCWSKSYMNLGRSQVTLEFITVKKGNSRHSQTCTLDFRKTDFSKVHKKAGMIP